MSYMSTKIAIAGAMGRMGLNLIQSALKNEKTEIVGIFDINNIDQTFLSSTGLKEENKRLISQLKAIL